MLNICLRENGKNKVIGKSELPLEDWQKLFPLIDDYLHNTLGIDKIFYYRTHAIPYECEVIIDFGEHHRFIVIKEVDD